ncbi:cation-transporting atpase 4 [Fusarium austroafricanum]|uniref:Cation-transporting atpase 4 n=1 Tax=Fusarium austroafricanum TaxID=2364996 RepID=A0A8H4P018_9HYPO|nr:cation-transporting atpase 4 [Fusarium austroafricanum]
MQTVYPRGDGMATFVLDVIMLVICVPTVVARFVIRSRANALGIDDWLMGLGMAMTVAWSGVLISYCFSGGGYDPTDPRLPKGIISQALKFYFICQSVYCPTTIPIKVSICAALMRIGGTVPVYRWSLIAIMVISTVSGIGSMIGIVASCSPPSAFWDPSTGECNAFVNTFAAYFISACSILTDFALAILPAFMLWKIQLRRSIKVSVAIILGFAAFASSATLVRLRYLLALLDTQNFLLGSGKIAVWTVIELGIGIFAGSLPALKPLLRYVPFLSHHNSEDNSHRYKKSGSGNDLDLVTFGGGTYGQSAHNPRAKKVAEDGDSQELILDEREGTQGIGVRKEVSVSVERRTSQDIDLERERYYGVARG